MIDQDRHQELLSRRECWGAVWGRTSDRPSALGRDLQQQIEPLAERGEVLAADFRKIAGVSRGE